MKRRTFISAGIGSALCGAAAWRLLQTPAGSMQRAEQFTDGMRLYSGADLAFGTTIGIQVLHRDQRQAELAIEDAFNAAKKVDALMSIYSEKSQVFQLNRDGRLARPDPHLLTVLAACQRFSALTGGAFDITVQPLWLAFTRAVEAHGLPSHEQTLSAKSRVGWNNLVFDSEQARFLQPGMAITLNGVAQGYAVDLALEAVRARGVEHGLLDTGEFISSGRKTADRPWMIGVQDPRHDDKMTAVLRMDGRSAATSGDYETTFTPDFVHHHIFDPATGDSPPEMASVTVVAPTGLQADGLSTALFVMGSEKALRLASQLPDVDVLMVDKQGKTWKSRGLREL
jgi:thiamine biosynthesis lipoprotein